MLRFHGAAWLHYIGCVVGCLQFVYIHPFRSICFPIFPIFMHGTAKWSSLNVFRFRGNRYSFGFISNDVWFRLVVAFESRWCCSRVPEHLPFKGGESVEVWLLHRRVNQIELYLHQSYMTMQLRDVWDGFLVGNSISFLGMCNDQRVQRIGKFRN